MTELYKIADFMVKAFIHIWPYLIITIPIAVAVNMSGASKHIKRAFDAGPMTAILLATLVEAFSPFCSCGVIPVIAVYLIGGVPLPPVMAFLIAGQVQPCRPWQRSGHWLNIAFLYCTYLFHW